VHVGGGKGKVPLNFRRSLIFNMAATAAFVNVVSVDFGENGLANRIHFDCACWGWVGEGSFRFSAISVFQYGRHRNFWFPSTSGERLGRSNPFRLGACWGWVREGSFRKLACFDFQYGHHLEIGFRRFCGERLVRSNQFYKKNILI
jgi:hypothetical protein